MIDYIKFDSIISKYRAENRWREARALDSKLFTITMQGMLAVGPESEAEGG